MLLFERNRVYAQHYCRYRMLFFAVFIICLAILITGCGKKKREVKERIANVRVAVVSTKAVRPSLESVGNLTAFDEVVVSSEVDGILKKIYVDEGSAVTAKSVIAEISETDYRLDVSRNEAALRQAKAALENIKHEYSRKHSLFKEELVTKQQFDDISARLVLGEAEVERIEAGLSLSKERFAKTKIYAPTNGMVKERKVTAGNYLRNGTPIASIVQVDPLKLIFTVTEKDVGRLKIGQDVKFKVDACPDEAFKGKLNTIYPHLEERTRAMHVEATVPNANRLLKPGFFARVVLYTGPVREAIVIPVTAVVYDGSETKAFTVEADQAKEKRLKTGQKYGEFVEILDGIKPGEQLVVVGQNNLAGGMKVNVAR